MTLPHARQLFLATAVRSTALAPVLHLQAWLVDVGSARADIQELRGERDALGARLLALQGVEEENRRLRALLELAERGRDRFRPANLTPAGRAGEGVKRSFVLDVGPAVGVSTDAPVVAAGGLVGIVRTIFAGQATGDFWTHPDFRVSAMTSDGRVFGIIRPLGGTPAAMQLDGAPFQAELPSGTELVTSGLGGVFPRGIPIGRVAQLTGAEAGWAKSYLVEPAVHPDAVREVMVLVERADTIDVTDVWERPAVGDGR
ncbi:MAG: rod shape-determining protein MreC [Gemmatimonadota bacterium]|nr:MAG: rod shape-determining protein MreC [Gemmatimonadota bacterium]